MNEHKEVDVKLFLETVGTTIQTSCYYNLLSEYIIDSVRNRFRSRDDFSDFDREKNESVYIGVKAVQQHVDRILIRLWNEDKNPSQDVRFVVEETEPGRDDGGFIGWRPPKFYLKWVVSPLPDEA